MPEASGSTTPSANDAAMAASMALPPARRARAPASDASGWPETTIPPRLVIAGPIGGASAISASVTSSSAASSAAAAARGR